MKSGGCRVSSIRESSNAFVLDGLKVTSHIAAHRVILSKSEFRQVAASWGLFTTMKRLVSSANKRMFEPMSLTMLFIKRRKSKGPRIDPWDTPALSQKIHL